MRSCIEKSNIIPIKKVNINININKKPTICYGEYEMKQNFFDPSKSSPPNNFINKLQLRMKIYESIHADNNDDNLVNE